MHSNRATDIAETCAAHGRSGRAGSAQASAAGVVTVTIKSSVRVTRKVLITVVNAGGAFPIATESAERGWPVFFVSAGRLRFRGGREAFASGNAEIYGSLEFSQEAGGSAHEQNCSTNSMVTMQ